MTCRVCGKEITKIRYKKPHDICSNECYITNLWNDRANEYKNGNNDNCIIIEGVMYADGNKNNLPDDMLGFSGRNYKIQMNDKRIVRTNSLWCVGIIPESYRIELSDNAKFID